MTARRAEQRCAFLERELGRSVRLIAILSRAVAGTIGDPLEVLAAAERLDELEQRGSWWTAARTARLLRETADAR